MPTDPSNTPLSPAAAALVARLEAAWRAHVAVSQALRDALELAGRLKENLSATAADIQTVLTELGRLQEETRRRADLPDADAP